MSVTSVDRHVDCDLDAIFDACDQNGSNYIERQEFHQLCEDLSLTEEEFEDIFRELDKDEDGRIGRDDFVRGFDSVVTLFTRRNTVIGTPSTTLSRASSVPFSASLSSSLSSLAKLNDDQVFISEEVELKNKRNLKSLKLSRNKGVFSHGKVMRQMTVVNTPVTERTLKDKRQNSDEKRGAAENLDSNKKRARIIRQRSRSLESLSRTSEVSNISSDWRTDLSRNSAALWEHFMTDCDLGYYLLSSKSQEHVCDLYQKLHSVEEPQVLNQFENVVLSIIKDVRQQQCENERLERSYKREKDIHGRHLKQLEEEMEVQIQKAEMRIRKDESKKLESQKEDMKKMFQTEITELQSNLIKVQTAESKNTRNPMVDELKRRLDEMQHANRQLKSQLTDVETTLAVTKSEVVNLKQDLDEKTEELDSDKSTLVEYMGEQESLSRQLKLLHQANKKLHDTNDNLREVLDSNRVSFKRQHSGHHSNPAVVVLSPYQRNSAQTQRPGSMRRGSIMSDYMGNNSHNESLHGESSLMDELTHNQQQAPGSPRIYADTPHGIPLPQQDSCEVDSLPDDMDSGHSTLRDIPDIDSEYEPNSIEEDLKPGSVAARRRHRERSKRRMAIMRQQTDSGNTGTESEIFESHDDIEEDYLDGFSARELRENYHNYEDESTSELDIGHVDHHGRPASSCSCGSSQGSRRSGSGNGQSNMGPNGKVLRIVPSQAVSPMKPITKEPEHVYKIILAGDAAVGKSSFIMRLCKDKFVNNISSTLGVDFQTKTIEVDGRVIALQLWDTAGQERFRSVAMSYFRRADGVLLLYDVTYERSFLNVRDWLDSIEEGTNSNKKTPIMIVGNKCDFREQAEAEGKHLVSPEDGRKLAKDVDAMFIESSAKCGDNILEAVTELTRVLRTNEDLEVRSAGMTLSDISKYGNKKKEQGSCCN